ncbi:MAG: UDP-N-acetylmuramoyl-tripeptide--D-alanyl-D-alanine ligase [Clostridiales Family XIII bacterium]|jgi:UDP-N-acetylmuramoyl-tripeptide--D-alanyl-D-alanine ligase|nr:UDP-N-acetylmuramoyl-tripeptide--D-alanyl-D-alanine ligase [Clostridiales Family XIII bacterium]
MKALKLSEIESAVHGKRIRGDADVLIRGVSKDSREVSETELFFPLKGEKQDGHRFIPDAIRAGCGNFIVSDADAVPQGEAVNAILVDDVLTALQNLAAYYIRHFDMKKIAVTGSTGKTTTKDMVCHICEGHFKTAKSTANMNNEIGLPLSILAMDEGVQAGVFEMGMYTAGEIDLLAGIVRPDIGIITNIGTAHIRNFESQDGIRDAKLEIANYMGAGGSLVINTAGGLLTEECALGPYRLIKVGNTGKSDFILSGVEGGGENGVTFFLEHGDEMQRFFLPVLGAHNAMNAALAAAAVFCLGISMKGAAESLEQYAVTNRLMGKNGMKVIDDTYNAGPDSMRAALDTLENVRGIRKIAILGDMNELGARSEEYHRQLGAYAAHKKVDVLITVGEKATGIAAGARDAAPDLEILPFGTKDAAWEKMKHLLGAGDVILVKGSRGMEMETLVKRIME